VRPGNVGRSKATPEAGHRPGHRDAAATADGSIIADDLAHAEKQVEIGETLLAETRARLQQKASEGLDVTEAEATLALLEQTQALRIADRDRLRRKLEALH
jgi:hypothetical protein